MPKIVYVPLKAAKAGQASSVKAKRVKTADGRTMTLLTIDADSKTFGDDLSYVFKKNVAKARRENKRLLGSSGRLSAKA